MVVIIKNNWFAHDASWFFIIIIALLLHTYSALVLDSYAHDQSKVEPYSIQVVKDIEAFFQIASSSVNLKPCPYKVRVRSQTSKTKKGTLYSWHSHNC